MLKEILGDSFNIIEESAPLLANILGAPRTLSWGLSLLTKIFGFNPDSVKVEDLSEALKSDPECTDKLCILENNLKKVIASNLPMLSEMTINIKMK